ncbi:MAG: choice-of-anchor L domain-containing protein [Bacteroidales bacterium]|nr:choice-of-anchor L domain-containing protein [Bacteroidales bacterium]
MKKIIFIIKLIIITTLTTYSQININVNINSQILTQTLQGSGVIISNLTYSNQNNIKTIALFSEEYKDSNLPITSGIVMATGNVMNVAQPGSATMADHTGESGIPELSNIVGTNTYNGVFIEFDFISLGDTIELTYIFGSEEYPEWVGSSYNDAFAIFLNGPNPQGGTYYNYNIALIPGTNIPVTINTVNSSSYSQFYINNDGTNQHPVFDGLTIALKAQARVVPNQQYHIKIAIADAGDYAYDSGLFLKAHSFKSNFSSNSLCSNSTSLCIHPPDTLPLTVSSISETGPNYACLCTQPNPSWYYLKVENSGDFVISINSPTGNDVDFICWGPFSDPILPCTSQLTANCIGCGPNNCPSNTTNPNFYPSGNVVDCSYSPSSNETLHISNAASGSYYIIMVTNYSNQTGKVVFNQINYGQPNAGKAHCINLPLCNIDSIIVNSISNCDTTNKYHISGTIYVQNPPANGFLIIKEPTSNTTKLINPPFQQETPFNISIPVTTNGTKLLNFYFVNDEYCNYTLQYTPPLIPDVLINYSNSNCGQSNGSVIAVIQNNGLPPYSYHWSTGYQNNNTTSTISYINNVPAGLYSVSIYNSNNCYSKYYIPVSDNQGPILDTSIVSNQCTGQCNGQITAIAQGNNFPYTYLWSTGNETIDNTGEGSTLSSLCDGTYFLTVSDANSCITIAYFSIPSLQELTYLIGTYTPPTCANSSNGYVEIIPQGGTPPYSINWSHNQNLHSFILSNLSAGTYYFTITDANNCSISDTLIVTSYDNLNISVTYQNPTCNYPANGSITINVTGGIGNINYYWFEYPHVNSNTLTNIPAGTYHVTVSDELHCSVSTTITLNNNNPLTANLVSITSPCQGEPAIAIYSLSGGQPPYYDGHHYFTTYDTLLLLDSVNIIVFSDYTGCMVIDTATVTFKPKPVVNISFGNPTCSNNGAIIAHVVSGIPPYSYYWSNGVIQENVNNNFSYNLDLTAGIYYLTVINGNGCSSTYSVTLTNLEMGINVTTTSSCGNCNGSVIIKIISNVAQPPYTFQYSNSVIHQNNVPIDTLYNLCAGQYYVTVTDGNNCQTFGTFSISDSLNYLNLEYNIIAPSCPGYSDGCIQIINVQGGTPPYQYIWGNNCQNNNYCCGFSQGTYTLTVLDANQCVSIIEFDMPDGNEPYVNFNYSIVNDTVYFTNLSSQGNYLWLFGDGQSSTLANPFHVYTAPNTYNVCLTLFSCDTITKCTELIILVNKKFTNEIIVFPNPFNNFIYIITDNNNENEICFYNIYGQKLITEKFTNRLILNTSLIKEGLYILEIKYNNGIYIKKLTKASY